MVNQQKYSEEQLIEILRERSERSFSILYDAYADVLLGIILKIVKNEDVAEDVLQESFIKIWQGVDKFDRSRGSLFTWLLNVARNHAIDYIRSGYARRQNSQVDISVCMEAEMLVELPIEMIGLNERLKLLAPETRVLIDKLYFQGYTQKEISDEMQIPLGTIKTRVRAAFSQLRVLLKEYKHE